MKRLTHLVSQAAREGCLAYLATLGRGKVGFTVIGQDEYGATCAAPGWRGSSPRRSRCW